MLSKFISLIFWYNVLIINYQPTPVVICFRNLYLWYSDTTWIWFWPSSIWLWFAFEIYIFDILIQRQRRDRTWNFRCDLLSKFISLIFWYNNIPVWCFYDLVVICFRNLYLWYSDTTSCRPITPVIRCDLLSKFISLIFWYN